MKLAILFEDDTIWISMSPEEFKEKLTKKLGPKAGEAIDELVAEIKQRTINA